MPDEALIIEIENIMADLVALGGENERTTIVPNLTVQDANPTNLDGFVIVSDDRDGDNILAKKVNSVIYSDNDLVNVIFIDGAEAVAFQQGSQSTNSGIWEIVPSTTTDIYYDKGNVGIGLSSNIDSDLVLNLNNWIGPAAISGNTVQGASYMEEGLVVNSDSEKEMIALKSPDVAHGMTTLAETDTAVSMRVFPGGFGGLQFTAYAEDDSAMAFFGRATNDNTDKSSAAYGPFVFNGQKKSGASVGAMGANANVFCVQNNNSTVWFCDTDGDTWQQGSITLGTDIIHEGDPDTKISFTADKFSVDAGGLNMLALTETTQDLVEIGDIAGSGDVDVSINNGIFFLRGSDDHAALGPDATVQNTSVLNIRENQNGATRVEIRNATAGNVAQAQIRIANDLNNAFQCGITSSTFTTGGELTADDAFFQSLGGIDLVVRAVGAGNIKFGTNATVRQYISSAGDVGIGTASPSAKLHVDQASTTAATPVLYLDQADVSEEMIEFNTTIGVGNAIEAVGAKTLTTTHFIKVTLPGGLTRYIPVGTIA